MGKYALPSNTIISESDCQPCPMGSYMSTSTFTVTQGQCVLCPAGKYQPAKGQASCLDCPNGETTFVQNYLQGPSVNQNLGAVSPDSCAKAPTGYLTLGYTYYYSTYDLTGTNTGGSTTVTFPSACNTFGKLYDGQVTGNLNSQSQCNFCTFPTDTFLAGGYTSINSISVCPPSSSCFTQYVYGPEVYYRTNPASDGSSYSYRVFPQPASAICTDACPMGMGNALVGDVKTCATCQRELGLYSSGQGQCLRCDKFHYPKTDGSSHCDKCPYPWTSRWNAQNENLQPPSDKYALKDYAQNVLQYHSCSDLRVDRSLCLCLQVPAVVTICGLIAVFFAINLLVFICCTIGRTDTNKAMTIKTANVKTANLKTEAKEVEVGALTSATPTRVRVTPDGTPEMAEPGPDMASESQDKNQSRDLGDVSFSTWTHSHQEDELPPAKPVLVGWRVLVGLMAYILIPFVDNLTDLAFIISNPFFNFALFICMIIFYCLPGLFFFKTLLDKKAAPRFYLVSMPDCLIFERYGEFATTKSIYMSLSL